MMKRIHYYLVIALAVSGLLLSGVMAWPAAAQSNSRYFAETGHTVRGAFLAYWEAHGGLAQQGYPISDEVQEVSPLDQQTYTMQYFERAVFEAHPENQPPYQVLLSQVGTFRYRQRYPDGAPNPTTSTIRPLRFPQTGHTVGGLFRSYWEAHGGLAQQGYPISEELQEQSDLDGKTYTVQYFERAVFEWHPENKAPYDVLLTQLGRFRWTIHLAKQAAAKLLSPPRMYSVKANGTDLWPDDTGATTQLYSTCGAAPVAEAPPTCEQPMTLTTAISATGAALDVQFSARWAGGRHTWVMRVAAGKAALVQETGDPLPPLPQ